MEKEVLSRQAGRVTRYIFKEKPSGIVPFIGNFPIVEDWRIRLFYKICQTHMYLDECPEWVQKAVIRGEQVRCVHEEFEKYLKDNKISDFMQKTSNEKKRILVKFMDENCLDIGCLRV